MGYDTVKRASRQKLFADMLHEFTTVAEGIRPPSEPASRNARLQMAIKAIGRIKEKNLKFKAELKETDGLDSHMTDKLDRCREAADILQKYLLQCLRRQRGEIKRKEADGCLRWLEEAHECFKRLEEELDSV